MIPGHGWCGASGNQLEPAEGSPALSPTQASQTEQELQRELDALRGQCQAQALAGAELRTRLESLQGEVSACWGWGLRVGGQLEPERLGWGLHGAGPLFPPHPETFPQNQMLQSRRQDLEAQIRSLREEVDKGQGRLQTTHEELLLLRREKKEHSLEVNYGGGGKLGP